MKIQNKALIFMLAFMLIIVLISYASASTTLNIPLASGSNLVGISSNNNIDVNQITFTNGTYTWNYTDISQKNLAGIHENVSYTFNYNSINFSNGTIILNRTSAISAGWIDSSIFYWNPNYVDFFGNKGRYERVGINNDGTMSSWTSYYLTSNVNNLVMILPTKNITLSNGINYFQIDSPQTLTSNNAYWIGANITLNMSIPASSNNLGQTYPLVNLTFSNGTLTLNATEASNDPYNWLSDTLFYWNTTLHIYKSFLISPNNNLSAWTGYAIVGFEDNIIMKRTDGSVIKTLQNGTNYFALNDNSPDINVTNPTNGSTQTNLSINVTVDDALGVQNVTINTYTNNNLYQTNQYNYNDHETRKVIYQTYSNAPNGEYEFNITANNYEEISNNQDWLIILEAPVVPEVCDSSISSIYNIIKLFCSLIIMLMPIAFIYKKEGEIKLSVGNLLIMTVSILVGLAFLSIIVNTLGVC